MGYIEIFAWIQNALAGDNIAQRGIELHRFEENLSGVRQMHPVFLQSQSICVSTNSETDGMRLSSDANLAHGEDEREAGSKSVSPNSRLRHSRLISDGTYTERLAFSMRRHIGQ